MTMEIVDEVEGKDEKMYWQFEERIGRFYLSIPDGFLEYAPRDESFWEYHESDGTSLIFPLAEVALDAAGLEDIMRRSLEQGKDLLFPLVKPYAWRTEAGVDY